ncbi:MAG: hypothetical protein K6E30_10480 [Lachnospiraceae bacterium]|nr:hypothetical protein [Lachnospiraceae bacterium]
MKNKLLKRISSAAASGILALSMICATGAPVLAEDTDTRIGIDKVLKFANGVTIPEDLKFAFDVTPLTVNGVAYNSSNMPSINQLVSSFAANSSAHDYYGQTAETDDGYLILTSEFILNLDDIAWPAAGLYVYQISENAAKSAALNASLDSKYSLSYSNSAYELQVGVVNNGEGYKVDGVTAKPITEDKVVVNEDGTTSTDPASGSPVTTDVVTVDENSDPDATTGKSDATPINPYGSDQADRDEDGNPDAEDAATATPADSTASTDGDAAGTTTAGDRPETVDAAHNGLTFTNTLTEVLGTEELPDEGQDLDDNPTDDPQSTDDDPDEGGHDPADTEDEAANYHFYIGKEVEGKYADTSLYYNFNLKLTGLAGTYKAYVVTMGDKDIWSYETAPKTAYNSSVTVDSTTYGCYELQVNDAAGFDFQLKHNQRLVFTRIGVGLKFAVTEAEENANGYETTYSYTSGGTVVSASPATIVAGKNSVDVLNKLPYNTPTGIVISNLPYILIALLVVGTLVGSVMLKSRKRTVR